MNMEYMGSLLLSVLIFAPGVVLLVTCGIIGIAILLEKAGVLDGLQSSLPEMEKPVVKPEPSPGVIERLSQAIEAEDEQFRDGTNN